MFTLEKKNTHEVNKFVALHEEQISQFCKLHLLEHSKRTNLLNQFISYVNLLHCLQGFCRSPTDVLVLYLRAMPSTSMLSALDVLLDAIS